MLGRLASLSQTTSRKNPHIRILAFGPDPITAMRPLLPFGTEREKDVSLPFCFPSRLVGIVDPNNSIRSSPSPMSKITPCSLLLAFIKVLILGIFSLHRIDQ